VTLPPAQKVVGPFGVTVGVGVVVTDVVAGADVAEQLPFVTLTVKLPDVVTLIDCVVAIGVAPLNH
jgi:hypothetical protein